jgi:hypothetical protein
VYTAARRSAARAASGSLEQRLQLLHRVVEVHLRGVLAATGDARDVAKGQLLRDAELEDEALLGRQIVEGGDELGAPLAELLVVAEALDVSHLGEAERSLM